MFSRRSFLAGALAGAATGVHARAPEVSPLPVPRPAGLDLLSVPSADALVEAAALGGRVGFAVADARSGRMLEVRAPLYGMPPASVAKAVTCAYGLDRLGPGYRFRTRLIAGGPVRQGRLDGDLWLVGGGDPGLLTDDLNALAAALRDAGLREVTGELKVADAILPRVREIDAEQPDHVGYNPAIGGLNLNYNRIHFEWEREGGAYTVALDARSETIRPTVTRFRMRVAEDQGPVYLFDERAGREEWSVARRALGQGGSRWLPVRDPGLYAAEVFQVLARSRGIVLDGPVRADVPPPEGPVLAEHVSPPLEDILRGMMRWSTNVTAEVVGLMASRAGGASPDSLPASGAEMARWMEDTLGARNPSFVDHSGLGVASRIRPQDMVRSLVAAGAGGLLRRLMKDVPMRDADGNLLPDHPVSVVAKTGTLNFVSSLAGYARTPGGRDLAFAIFAGDTERRAVLSEAERERPPGARDYNRRAKRLQQQLIERWAALYDTV